MEYDHFLVIPPHFDGNNYAYWKVIMKTFLKSMNEFKGISNVEVAHTTWDILHTVHEGTKAVKINKL